jgi:lipopolysaccharide transport system ATP-binding protein
MFGKEKSQETNKPIAQPITIKTGETLPQGFVQGTEDKFSTRMGYNPNEYRWGNNQAIVLDYLLMTNGEEKLASIESGAHIKLYVKVLFNQDVLLPILGLNIKTKEGVTVYGTNSELLQVDALRQEGKAGNIIIACFDFQCQLSGGDYFISVGIAAHDGGEVVPLDRRYDSIHINVKPDQSYYGLCNINCKLNLT